MASPQPIPPFDELTYHPTARWIRATPGKERSSTAGARCWPGSPAGECRSKRSRTKTWRRWPHGCPTGQNRPFERRGLPGRRARFIAPERGRSAATSLGEQPWRDRH